MVSVIQINGQANWRAEWFHNNPWLATKQKNYRTWNDWRTLKLKHACIIIGIAQLPLASLVFLYVTWEHYLDQWTNGPCETWHAYASINAERKIQLL